ncbi:MAG: hypothetical protein QM715_20380 [Nibricoccus sp.]
MDNDDLDNHLKAHLRDDAPSEVHVQASLHFGDFAASLSKQRATAKNPRGPLLWFWAGAGLSGGIALVALAVALLFSPAPSWAQVAERFRSLKFFNATVFYTENSGQAPEKIDLWVAQDRRMRAHYRGLIFFGAEGRLTKVISAEKGLEIPLDELQYQLRGRDGMPALPLVRGIARFSEEPNFSIDKLLGLLSGKREQLQPTPNTDAVTSNDLQVFDFTDKNNPEWVRLWALKKSELPVRLRIWDPCDGGQTDLVFDYATQMPEVAFAPERVQMALQEKQGATNRLYAMLPDSGGQPITPEHLFAIRGYHLPEIDTVGRTPEGVVWVLSRNVENRRPDGERIYGWNQLNDNLGQTYTHRVIGWLTENNTLLEYFVPENLDSSFHLPASYTLICQDSPSSSSSIDQISAKIIGSVAVGAWQETAFIPDLVRAKQNEIDGRTNWQLMAMDDAAGKQDWKKFEEIATSIPGNPETDLVALTRDVKRAHKLFYTREQKAMAALCARLYPLVSAGVKQGQPYYSNIVRWHVASLLREGQRVEARVLANRHATEALARSRIEGPQFVVNLMFDLRLAGLSEAETESFFDRTIISQQSVRRQLDKTRIFLDPTAELPTGRPSVAL